MVALEEFLFMKLCECHAWGLSVQAAEPHASYSNIYAKSLMLR